MQLYRLLFVLIIGAYLLSPLLVDSWQGSQTTWYRPFIIWGVLIMLAILLEWRRRRDEF